MKSRKATPDWQTITCQSVSVLSCKLGTGIKEGMQFVALFELQKCPKTQYFIISSAIWPLVKKAHNVIKQNFHGTFYQSKQKNLACSYAYGK